MDINEVRQRKLALEQSIKAAILQFEDETGGAVDQVFIYRENITSFLRTGNTASTLCEVGVSVRIE
jgi:hypothetical protein